MPGEKREGRGRLSSIDRLPVEADPHIQWAAAELLNRDFDQIDILQEFNERLAGIGCGPISRSAFSRYSLKKAVAVRALAETREISKVVAETLGPERADHITIMLVELLKNAAYQLSVTGSLKSKDVLDLSRALQALIGAQRKSGELRREDESEQEAKVNKAIDAVAEKKGLSKETVREIKASVLGLNLSAGDAS